jgi:hypothetical protein
MPADSGTLVVPFSLGAAPPPAGQEVWSASRAQATRAPDAFRGVHVLLVQDTADARDLLATLLTSAGAEVALAASAPEALACLLDHNPDVLVHLDPATSVPRVPAARAARPARHRPDCPYVL